MSYIVLFCVAPLRDLHGESGGLYTPKAFGASEEHQIRERWSGRVRRRRVTVKAQPRLASELGDDGPGERGRILGRPQLAERNERRFAHLDAVGPRFAAHVVHRENQEGVVRGLRHTVPDREDRSRAARDVRLLLHFALDGSHDRLARLDVPGRNRPEPFRETVRLADDEERVLADKERAHADGDGQRRDIHGHRNPRVRRARWLYPSLPSRAAVDRWGGRSRSRRGDSCGKSGNSGTSTCRVTAAGSPTPRTRASSGPST